jgi:hypothetical protein
LGASVQVALGWESEEVMGCTYKIGQLRRLLKFPLFAKNLNGNSTSEELCVCGFALLVDGQAESLSYPVS